MELENSRLISLLLKNISILFLVYLMLSCATSEKQPTTPTKQAVKLEPPASLFNWHDVTHKSYYGLKGRVRTLTVKPAELRGEKVSDNWVFTFNRDGRLVRKENTDAGFRTEYSYSAEGELTAVSSYRNGKLWRNSKFIFEKGQVVKINFSDSESGDQQTVSVSRQLVSDGWFEIQKPITSPGLPAYARFQNDNRLIWSNKGDINNGLGELYYLRTVDNVTSSSITNNSTVYMKGQGGYRYLYEKDGLLKAVESYNAHANRLFHRTSYQYNDLGLLQVEERVVSGESPFNQAVNEKVTYDYLAIDRYGNWLKRKLTVISGFQTQVFTEYRSLEYYPSS